MKVHLFSSHTLEQAPQHVINDYQKQGLNGTKCGYVRERVTYDESKVTCKLCILEMNKSE